jgi:hypothetical protein
LHRAGAGRNEAWTRINTWDVYDGQLEHPVNAAECAGLSLAVWELYVFEGQIWHRRLPLRVQ